MPNGQSHEIVMLPGGYYRMRLVSAKAVWSNRVNLVDLNRNEEIANVSNEGEVEVKFQLEGETLVRFTHTYRQVKRDGLGEEEKDFEKGSIKRVFAGNDRDVLQFCCEDWKDDDYDDLRFELQRYDDDAFTKKVPVMSGVKDYFTRAEIEERFGVIDTRLMQLEEKLAR